MAFTMAKGRSATESRYRGERLAALATAQELLRQGIPPALPALDITLTLISPTALQAFKEGWGPHSSRRYPWPWPEMAEDYRRGEPGRFEVAVWSGDRLCGLALGKTRTRYVSADYLEGSPEPQHPFKGRIALIVSITLDAYARQTGRPEIRFVDPIFELVPQYKALGFELVDRGAQARYCARKVRR